MKLPDPEHAAESVYSRYCRARNLTNPEADAFAAHCEAAYGRAPYMLGHDEICALWPMLPETQPEHVYAVLQGAGIVRGGRPIRGNYYCYKLDREHEPLLRHLMEHCGSTSEITLAFLAQHERRWSHRVDRDGKELP